jgi:two-component system, response regulator RegA
MVDRRDTATQWLPGSGSGERGIDRDAISRQSEPIDVVLLDFRLPDSADLELLAEIRRRLPASAIVLMTAFGTPEVIEGAMRLGAHAVLTKPFDMHGIDALVRSAHQAVRRY